MRRSRLFRNDDRRRLERKAARGDAAAMSRLAARDPLAADAKLRASGRAGRHYGRLLLDLVPAELRVPGTKVVWPEDMIAAPCVIHEVGGEVREVEQDRQKGHRQLRPCWALDLPDGFGAKPDGSRVGMVMVSVALSVRPVGSDWRVAEATTTGAAVVSVTGAHYMGMGPYLYLERRLRSGWSDEAFVRTAARLYDVGLERARALGPMALVAGRADRLLDEVAGEFPAGPDVFGVPDYEGYRERMRRRQSFIDRLRLRTMGHMPWIHAYPFAETGRRWGDEAWPAEEFLPWSAREIEDWNRLLDEVEANKAEWSGGVRRT